LSFWDRVLPCSPAWPPTLDSPIQCWDYRCISPYPAWFITFLCYSTLFPH
jgi:hypothetical protein